MVTIKITFTIPYKNFWMTSKFFEYKVGNLFEINPDILSSAQTKSRCPKNNMHAKTVVTGS